MAVFTKAPGALAYSYIRFSSPEQRKGDSLRRQTDAARRWAESNGVKLDESTTYQDLGKSAYLGEHKKNPDRHRLAAFLKMVEGGTVPRGSFLIIENLDRLSREHIRPALSLFLGLIDAGIRIVTLGSMPMIYDDESLNADTTPLILAIVELTRGHRESAVKSERVGAAWRMKKRAAGEKGETLTARTPAWITIQDGRRVIIEKAKRAIQRIFELAIDGLGTAAIVKRLTEEKVEPIGTTGRWVRSYVVILLTDKRVIGEYQPRFADGKPDGDAIKGYFPAVINPDVFWMANGERKKRKRTTVKNGELQINFFAGLMCRAGHPEDKYYIAQRVEKRRPGHKSGKTNKVYINTRSAEGLAPCESFPVHVFDNAVIGTLVGLKPDDILGPSPGIQLYEGRKAELEAVEARLKSLEAELMEADPGTIRILTKVAGELEGRRVALVEEVAHMRADIANPRADSFHGMVDAWGVLQQVADSGGDLEGAKLKLRSSIKRLVKCIHCLFMGFGRKRSAFITVEFHDNPNVQTYSIDYWPTVANASGTRPESWYTKTVEQLPDAETNITTLKGVEKMRAFLDVMHQKITPGEALKVFNEE